MRLHTQGKTVHIDWWDGVSARVGNLCTCDGEYVGGRVNG